MKTYENNYENLKKQWHKFMNSFFEYLPTRYKARSQRDWDVRHMIWDFKDGKRTKAVAALVASQMNKAFEPEDLNSITFVCVPASSEAKTVTRYKEFCEEVASLTGCRNGYIGVKVTGERLAVHETAKGKRLQPVQVIDIDRDYFNGSRCIVFDDILTRGYTYARFASYLESYGANVLGGLFLAKTVQPVENEEDAAR